MEEETIKICYEHQDKEKTPLIWTFSFNGAEFWCPACGANTGMFGGGDNVPWTWVLHNRHLRYTRRSRRYLRANSALVCIDMWHKGKRITFKELPERAKNYYINQAKKWEHKF